MQTVGILTFYDIQHFHSGVPVATTLGREIGRLETRTQGREPETVSSAYYHASPQPDWQNFNWPAFES